METFIFNCYVVQLNISWEIYFVEFIQRPAQASLNKEKVGMYIVGKKIASPLTQ